MLVKLKILFKLNIFSFIQNLITHAQTHTAVNYSFEDISFEWILFKYSFDISH